MTLLCITGGTMDRKKANAMDVNLRIGKNGLSSGMVNEIVIQLKKHKMIKIKLLKSVLAGNRKENLVEEITEKTNSSLVNKIGNTITIKKL